MVMLEQYITLYERESKFVFSAWKAIQILIYFFAAVSGIIASYSLGQLSGIFDSGCFLFSNITFNGTSASQVDILKTEWGKESYCQFCQYVPVSSVIFSVVWATFFTMCGRGGKTTHGLSQPWRIVYPALIFNITFFLVALVAAIKLQQGIDAFCTEFIRNNNEAKCRDLAKYIIVGSKTGETAFIYIVMAQVASWINVCSWILGVLLLLLRCLCVADFTVMKITVIAPTPDDEPQPHLPQRSAHCYCPIESRDAKQS
ncbi:transmembrane protein 179 isoform X2 [Anabrus simplex]|uniref:transmembrane protein 179 isoform X2 n=1 Tax=Anabrus simplex TaxID=316456 RepID=UPI0034DD3F1E